MDSHESFQAASADTSHNVFDEIETTIEHDIQAVVSTVTGLFHEVFPSHDAAPHFNAPDLQPLFQNPSLDPAQALATSTMVGDPFAEMPYWHHQESSNTCAIASQQYIIEQLTGEHLTEGQLVAQAEVNGWFDPASTGTAEQDCGRLMELHGLHVEQHHNATIDEIAAQLRQGHGVIAGVRVQMLSPENPSAPLTSAGTIPDQGANHAVEVTGINRSDPTNPMVILNDPAGVAGEMIPMSTFLTAWSTSDNFVVEAW